MIVGLHVYVYLRTANSPLTKYYHLRVLLLNFFRVFFYNWNMYTDKSSCFVTILKIWKTFLIKKNILHYDLSEKNQPPIYQPCILL